MGIDKKILTNSMQESFDDFVSISFDRYCVYNAVKRYMDRTLLHTIVARNHVQGNNRDAIRNPSTNIYFEFE